VVSAARREHLASSTFAYAAAYLPARELAAVARSFAHFASVDSPLELAGLLEREDRRPLFAEHLLPDRYFASSALLVSSRAPCRLRRPVPPRAAACRSGAAGIVHVRDPIASTWCSFASATRSTIFGRFRLREPHADRIAEAPLPLSIEPMNFSGMPLTADRAVGVDECRSS
jgi:hypothetical protein